MTDEMLVEAVARVFWETAQRLPIAWELAPESSREMTRIKTRAAIEDYRNRAPEMRAAGEMKRALAPFARFLEIHDTMGGPIPHEGELWTVHSRAGSATIAVEDLRAARAALALASSPGQQSTHPKEPV